MKSRDILIDGILTILADTNCWHFESVLRRVDIPSISQSASLYQYMLNEGLITAEQPDQWGNKDCKITHSALKIVEQGGWIKFLEESNAVHQDDSKIRKLTIKNLEGAIFQIKYWWALALTSGLIGGIITILVQISLKKIGAL